MKHVKVETAVMAGAIAIIAIGVGVCDTMSSLSNKYEDALMQIEELNSQIKEQQSEIQNANDLYNQIVNEKQEIESRLSETTEELEIARREIDEYNRIVSFNSHNITISSGSTIEHMRRALKGTGLYDDAQSFVDAETLYGVNAFFLAALAAQESSWGTSSRAISQNNLTGHAVYDSNAKGSYFNSRYESVLNTAHLIKEEYLTPGGSSYNGLSVVDVNKRYCFLEDRVTIDYNWSSKITQIAEDLVYKANDFKRL